MILRKDGTFILYQFSNHSIWQFQILHSKGEMLVTITNYQPDVTFKNIRVTIVCVDFWQDIGTSLKTNTVNSFQVNQDLIIYVLIMYAVIGSGD